MTTRYKKGQFINLNILVYRDFCQRKQVHATMKRPMSMLLSFRSVLVYSLLIPPTLGLRRTVGPPNDPRFTTASKACNGSDRKEFEFGVCSLLITCIYEELTEVVKASLSSGTNIVSLLPTILVLIGMSSPCYVPYSSFALASCSTLKTGSTSPL